MKSEIVQVAGGVVINRNGDVLVVNQSNTSWSLPKGHVDNGEEELATAIREIYEESGVSDLHLIKPLGNYHRFALNADGTEDKSEYKCITMYMFRTAQTELSQKVPNNPEAIWVAKNKVMQLLTHVKDKEFFLSIINDKELAR